MKLIKLLLVEDDLSDRMSFTRFVKKRQLPYDYKIAESIAEATVILKENQFDIVLTDHDLGDGTSFELLERIPETTPVIFVTGTGNEGIAVEAMKRGAADYLTKDIDGNYLTLLPLTIEAVLKNSALNKELDAYRKNLEELVEKRTFELKQEVQERKEIEQELVEEKERILVTLRSIGDAVIATDRNGDVTQMNPIAERLTGWTLEESRGLSIKKIFPIIDATTRKPIHNPIDKVIETGTTVYLSNHTTLISKNGTEYQISDSAAPIRNDDNAILGMVLVFNNVTEEYLLRTKLLEERLVLRDIIDSSPDLIFLKSPEGVYLRCNKAFEKFFGSVESEIIGKNDFDFVDADMAQYFRDKDKDALEKGASQLNEERVTYPDGRAVYLETLKTPVRDVSGKVLGLLGVSRDITQRKLLEDEIHSSMQHLKLYREQTPLAAIEWNTDFQVVDWNEAAEAMFGYTLEEAKDHDFVDALLPESGKVTAKAVWRGLMARTGGTVSVNKNITKEGRIILCEWHNTALIDDVGKVIGAASLVMDVTSEHKAKRALEQQAKEQKEILNTLSDGVITIDETGKILSYNQTAETLFGYSYDEAVGQNIALLMPDSEKHQHDGHLQHYIETSIKKCLLASREMVGQHKNKTTFPMRLTVAELPMSVGGKRRFIGSCQDLSQVKEQQAQLQRAQKMDAMGKLVGGIAHDYNNMLGVVLGYTDLITMKYSDVEGLQKYVDNIAQAGERGRNLTQRMLAFSKQESTHIQAVSINGVLEAQKEFFSKSITARIKLDYKLTATDWVAWVDPGELEDALLNLTLNAQHAMPEGGTLTFATDTVHFSHSEAQLLGLSENDYLRLSVTDTGCGMNEEVKNKIFDPFFSTKGAGGTGLGLSQVYGFMERAGGAVNVSSEVGVGTEFVFCFPRYRGDVRPAPEQNLPGKTSISINQGDQGGGESILIVDDEPALRVLAREILMLAGYRVFVASDGHGALKVLAANQIDLVLSDVIMPGMDGYQLAQQIQKSYPTIKIQLASGFSDNRHQSTVDGQLHNTLLHKPYASTELLARITQLLSEQKNEKS